ncbi:glycosyltransferase family 87 protein [Ruegeria sp.]|uniref:glycosyltransferase family 87 protein n=1 Tax=Ruegeria sp. TaxID=1879320 RepID=UPI003C79F701
MSPNSQPELEAKTAADARLRVFDTKRGWQLGTLVPVLVVAVCAVWVAQNWQNIIEDGARAAEIDFTVFWAAAKLAYSGDPLAAFNPDTLVLVHGIYEGKWMPWLYPPGFLIALIPLGAFSFPIAWIIFISVSLLAMLAAIRQFAGGVTPVWIGFSVAPAMLPALIIGQTSVLWIACLLAALASLRSGRPIMAGVLIGFLTLKPQLGILIPVALLACFAWRTIAAAAVTTLILAAVSTLIMGAEYWVQMKELAEVHVEVIREASIENHLMVSLFSILLGMGVSEVWAFSMQWCATGLAAITVALAWYSPRVDFDLRAATLLLAIMVSSPYFWYYESAVLAPAALFLLRAGVLKTSGLGSVLAALMWLGAVPATLFIILSDIRVVSVRFTLAPVAFAACLVCLFAVIQRLRSPELPEFKNEVPK